MDIVYFESGDAFRGWLQKNHDKSDELWVGFYKAGSGKTGITYREAVDQALCFGWIDGVRKAVDAKSYTNRFTPRRPRSIWSAVNLRRVEELTKLGLMHESGLAALGRRSEDRSRIYSFENTREMDPEYESRFRANEKAWAYFEAQPPSYRRTVCHWVMSAVREETRLRRLAALIEDSERGRWIGPMQRPGRTADTSG
jgi:uncharacterized protein YdeI (YjbR/CyaY-like superfamily)